MDIKLTVNGIDVKLSKKTLDNIKKEINKNRLPARGEIWKINRDYYLISQASDNALMAINLNNGNRWSKTASRFNKHTLTALNFDLFGNEGFTFVAIDFKEFMKLNLV